MRSSKAVNLACRDLCNIPDSVFEEALEVPCSIVDLSKNRLTEVPKKYFPIPLPHKKINTNLQIMVFIQNPYGFKSLPQSTKTTPRRHKTMREFDIPQPGNELPGQFTNRLGRMSATTGNKFSLQQAHRNPSLFV